MSDSNCKGTDLSQPRSHTMGLTISKEGRDPAESTSSQHKPQYTSAKNIPATPAPSHSSSHEAGHAGKTLALDEGLRTTTKKPGPESPSHSNDQPAERGFSRTRLVARALYHKYNPQIIFENRGSTARDHLASERTFLAYVRTSLALASTGVALVQLFTIADLTSSTTNTPIGEASKRVQKFARPLGVSTIIMALIMLGIGMASLLIAQFNLLTRSEKLSTDIFLSKIHFLEICSLLLVFL